MELYGTEEIRKKHNHLIDISHEGDKQELILETLNLILVALTDILVRMEARP